MIENFTPLVNASFGEIQSGSLAGSAMPRDIVFSPDGSLIVVSSANGKILIWGIP